MPKDDEEVMGVAEAAAALGVARSNLATVAGLPEPKQRLACGSLWKASDIRELAERRRKAKGAPAGNPFGGDDA